MGTLRTGRRYEILFGPGLDLASHPAAASIDSAIEQVCRDDPDAVILSAASDGLKVIGSDLRSAIDGGRDACSIHCRVFDRQANQELSNDLERARAPAPESWTAPVAAFDPRSAAMPAGRKSKKFTMPTRRPGTHR